MAFTFRQDAIASGVGTSITAVASSGDTVTGNLLVVCTTCRAPITNVTDFDAVVTYSKTTGTQDTFGPTTWGDIWYAVAGVTPFGGPAATSTSSTSADKSVTVTEYTVDTKPFSLDKVATGTGFSTAALTAATPTTTSANELLVGMIGNEGGTRTVVPDATFTERQDAGVCSTEYSDKAVVATGAYTYSGTVSGASSVWVACIATFFEGGLAIIPSRPRQIGRPFPFRPGSASKFR